MRQTRGAGQANLAKATIFLRFYHVVEVVQALLQVMVCSFFLIPHIPRYDFPAPWRYTARCEPSKLVFAHLLELKKFSVNIWPSM
jgi:hypothetical protein